MPFPTLLLQCNDCVIEFPTRDIIWCKTMIIVDEVDLFYLILSVIIILSCLVLSCLHRGDGYIEMDINVHRFASLPKKALQIVAKWYSLRSSTSHPHTQCHVMS